ncbi:MAG: SEC-C metal-binding domain-containing protein, partial [Casimicrobium sp.]
MIESITPPVSRNDPCPCGSGKRYKHCHGVANDAAVASATLQSAPVKLVAQTSAEPDLATIMHDGLAAHQSGRLDAAKTLYAQALAIDPNLPDVIHMSGVIALTEGRAEEALTLIERAM